MSTTPRESPPNRRARQAEQTRREIIQAARHRFAASGYAATSLKDIATEAGVSVQTIYDSVGSKADLVRELNDLIDSEAGVLELVAAAVASTDAVAIASLPARITRRILERSGDIVRVALDGAHAEAALRPAVDEGDRRHRQGAEMVAHRLAELEHLRPGLDRVDAARTLAVLSDAQLGILLLDNHGLDLDQMEAWMTDAILRSVLTEHRPPPGRPRRPREQNSDMRSRRA